MEFLLSLAYTAIFIFLINKMSFFVVEGVSKKTLQVAFIVKIISGFLLSLIYTYYYTNRLAADTFKFYDDSKVIYDLFFTDRKTFWQFMIGLPHDNDTYIYYSNLMNNWWNKYSLYNEGRTITRLNVLMRFISLGYYHVHNVLFCFLSFTGLVALVKIFSEEIKTFRKQVVFLVLFFPSIVFWSSGVLKDGLVFLCVGLALYFMKKAADETGRKHFFILASIIFTTALLFVKLHVFFIFFPCYIAFAINMLMNKNTLASFVITFIAFIAILVSFHHFYEPINFLNYLVAKQKEFIFLAKEVKAGSLIAIQPLEPTVWSIVKNSPVAFFNVLTRPHIHQANSPFVLLSALENWFILLFITSAFYCTKRKGIHVSPLFYFSLLYLIFLFTLIGLITPVMGAMVRYKIQALPFLFFILLKLIDREKLLIKFSFLKSLMR